MNAEALKTAGDFIDQLKQFTGSIYSLQVALRGHLASKGYDEKTIEQVVKFILGA